MTWRRFLNLLRGLSPQSATVAAASSRVEMGADRKPIQTVEGPTATQHAFVALFGRGKAGPKEPSA